MMTAGYINCNVRLALLNTQDRQEEPSALVILNIYKTYVTTEVTQNSHNTFSIQATAMATLTTL
jgi:hypothetical protein